MTDKLTLKTRNSTLNIALGDKGYVAPSPPVAASSTTAYTMHFSRMIANGMSMHDEAAYFRERYERDVHRQHGQSSDPVITAEFAIMFAHAVSEFIRKFGHRGLEDMLMRGTNGRHRSLVDLPVRFMIDVFNELEHMVMR